MPENSQNLGKPVSFAIGDTIYSQGSQSKGVYMIMSGQVDIWRSDGSQAHHIAAIGEGELLGEVSVIERRNHSVTAKASKPTEALFIDADAFRHSFADPLVRHVVNTLAARLRSSYVVTQSLENADTLPTVDIKSEHPTLEGASPLVAEKFLSFVELKDFPYRVGNIASPEKHCIITRGNLRVPLISTPELAINHFEVIRRNGEIYVRDLGSTHGTLVNGVSLSKYSLSATARLHPGKNSIVAGGPESLVRFALTVPHDYQP